MIKNSPLLIFLLVIIAPVFLETLGSILVEIGFHYLRGSFTSPLFFAFTKNIFRCLSLILYAGIILKIYPVKKDNNKAHFFKNLMLPFATIILSVLIQSAIGEHDVINIFFAKLRACIETRTSSQAIFSSLDFLIHLSFSNKHKWRVWSWQEIPIHQI